MTSRKRRVAGVDSAPQAFSRGVVKSWLNAQSEVVMRDFAQLLNRLSLTASRSTKCVLVRDYLACAPDPDRGYSLAALTGALHFRSAKAGAIRTLIEARLDPQLFAWSYDFVGDLAETVALAWPAQRRLNREPSLAEVVEGLQTATRDDVLRHLEDWLDVLDADGRFALLKLITGGLRVGVSARLAHTALVQLGQARSADVKITDLEEIWHGLSPPYLELFAWLDGQGPRPSPPSAGRFRPAMLAHALDEATDLDLIDPADFAAEWKWDGVRVQAVREADMTRLYSRTGEDLSPAFPDLVSGLFFEGVVDGELLVRRGDTIGAFSDLQQRLNRKTAAAKLQAQFPAMIRAYDLLSEGADDLRPLPFRTRRERLERLVAAHRGDRLDLSPILTFSDIEALTALRAHPPLGEPSLAEGVMLKRWDSPYLPGRPKGYWFKWKRDPHLIDAVLLYAQRGHGKRSGLYSDFTFGVWRDGALTPVGKAYFGFTDAELKRLDQFVRTHTVETFGPVRRIRAEQETGLVFEVAFDGVQRSARHKSGVALRFPRIHRIRWDKPPREADGLHTLEGLLSPEARPA